MASYTPPTISNYNDSPAPDDGTETASNEITWQKIKEELTDPINTYADSINSAVSTAMNLIPTTTIKTKSSDSTDITGVLAIDTDFSFTPEVSSNYLIQYYLTFTSTTIADFQFQLTNSISITDTFEYRYMPSTGTMESGYTSGAAVSLTVPNAAEGILIITGLIRVGATASPTVTLLWAQDTANASPATVKAGSSLIATRLI